MFIKSSTPINEAVKILYDFMDEYVCGMRSLSEMLIVLGEYGYLREQTSQQRIRVEQPT